MASTFFRILSILLIPALAMVAQAQGLPAPSETEEDEAILKEAKLATDGPNLLEIFRKRIPNPADQERVQKLLKQLGDKDFQTREKATTDLISVGPLALPALKEAGKNADAEVRRRSERCLQAIERDSSASVTAAAVRLVKARRPKGAVPVLLGFLPFAHDEGIEEELINALIALGVDNGRVVPEIAVAKQDANPTRRGLSALLLGRYGTVQEKESVRTLLRDSNSQVRFRAAQGLLAGRDKTAVPILVALLDEKPEAVANQAEQLLNRLAGDRSPKLKTENSRSAAWAQWWNTNESQLDWAKADVDLLVTNPSQQARKVAQEFVDALFTGNMAVMKRVAAIPFYMPGEQVFKTQEELTAFTEELSKVRPPGKISFKIQQVVSVEEYAKIAPQNEREMLRQLRLPQVRAVYVTAKDAGVGEGDGGAVLVRERSGRFQVVGIGEGHPNKKHELPKAVAKPVPPPPVAKDKAKK